MTGGAPRLADYLGHMLDAIQRVRAYTQGTDEAAFMRDQLLQDAVIRNIEIMGEASSQILSRYPDFGAKHPDLPLRAVRGMRNAISHGYFTVNLRLVWQAVEHDVPQLATQLKEVREEVSRVQVSPESGTTD